MAVQNYDPVRSSTQSSVTDMSTSPKSQPIGPTLAAALIKVKADQEKRERLAEQPKTPGEQTGSLERKEALSPSSQAVESGDVTPGHEGVKRKDRKTWHQPPTGYFESTK